MSLIKVNAHITIIGNQRRPTEVEHLGMYMRTIKDRLKQTKTSIMMSPLL